jgi:hypothetical protein
MKTTTTSERGRLGEVVSYFLRLGLPGFGGKVSNPLLIAATAVVGLLAFPNPEPSWVMVK